MRGRRFTLSMLESQLAPIIAADKHHAEQAAFLFCRLSETDSETRFLVREVQLITPDQFASQSPVFLGLPSSIYRPALAKAEQQGDKLVLLHTHPGGYAQYSSTDDQGEYDMFSAAYNRGNPGPHGSVLVIGTDKPYLIGRVWAEDMKPIAFSRIRVVGNRLRIFDRQAELDFSPSDWQWADRQMRAFGEETQQILKGLTIGLVGAGGHGSPIAQQLYRLGAGRIIAIDYDHLDETSLNRVYGSNKNLAQEKKPKVDLIKEEADAIGLGTEVITIRDTIYKPEIAQRLRDCDLIFGCTDDQLGRLILNRIAIWYYVPVLDLGFSSESIDNQIKDVVGRISILFPGAACLNCRGRIDQRRMRSELLKPSRPEEYEQLTRLGYIPELGIANPAIISFTTGTAALAINEMLHMLTGFMGSNRESNEILLRFNHSEINTFTRRGSEQCYCSDPAKWGKGDERIFLGMNLPLEEKQRTLGKFLPAWLLKALKPFWA